MATYDQAIQALREADKAGNVDDAKKLAAIAKRLKPQVVQPANQPQTAQMTEPDELDRVSSILDKMLGGLEVAGTMVSGAIAEPLAGIAGMATSMIPGLEKGAGAGVVEGVRDRLTYAPKTEAGQQGLQEVGEIVKPVTDAFSGAEDYLGNNAFEVTGSPAIAAAAKSIPTAIAEILGIAGAKGVTKLRAVKAENEVIQAIGENAPSIDQLKEVSRSIYKEIDDMGVSVKDKAYRKMVANMTNDLRASGLDKDITPNASRALQRFSEKIDKGVTLSDLDTLRKVAQNAAKSTERADSALGMKMIEYVDDFLDNAGRESLISAGGNVADISKRYKVARDLWGRARRSEMLQEAFEKARNQASGFENGIRAQIRSLINNKRTRKYFNREELEALTRVVRGDKSENIAKLIGRLGYSEGGATNIVGGAISATAGASLFGPAGAVAFPLIGQVSRNLAQRMTANNAIFADQVIRAGKDARKIIKAYFDETDAKDRTPEELAQLLTRPDIKLEKLPDNVVSIEAAKLAKQRRLELYGTLAAGASAPAAAEN